MPCCHDARQRRQLTFLETLVQKSGPADCVQLENACVEFLYEVSQLLAPASSSGWRCRGLSVSVMRGTHTSVRGADASHCVLRNFSAASWVCKQAACLESPMPDWLHPSAAHLRRCRQAGPHAPSSLTCTADQVGAACFTWKQAWGQVKPAARFCMMSTQPAGLLAAARWVRHHGQNVLVVHKSAFTVAVQPRGYTRLQLLLQETATASCELASFACSRHTQHSRGAPCKARPPLPQGVVVQAQPGVRLGESNVTHLDTGQCRELSTSAPAAAALANRSTSIGSGSSRRERGHWGPGSMCQHTLRQASRPSGAAVPLGHRKCTRQRQCCWA